MASPTGTRRRATPAASAPKNHMAHNPNSKAKQGTLRCSDDQVSPQERNRGADLKREWPDEHCRSRWGRRVASKARARHVSAPVHAAARSVSSSKREGAHNQRNPDPECRGAHSVLLRDACAQQVCAHKTQTQDHNRKQAGHEDRSLHGRVVDLKAGKDGQQPQDDAACLRSCFPTAVRRCQPTGWRRRALVPRRQLPTAGLGWQALRQAQSPCLP